MAPVAVFVFDGHDVAAYASVQAAESGTEVYDIGDLVYLGDDGTVLAAVADGYRVRLHPTSESRPDDLRARLRSYLELPGVEMDPLLADTPRILAQVLLDREWEVRRFRWLPWLDRRLNGQKPQVGTDS